MARHLIDGDRTIKARIKPGARSVKEGEATTRLNDGDGLYLLLFVKGGAHAWRLDYTFKGKRKTLSLGTYPDTGLEDARTKADQYRKLIAAGTNPSDVRKSTKEQEQAANDAKARAAAGLPSVDSFEAVAREWVETIHQAKVSEGHAARTLIRFEQDVFPWIGKTTIGDITPPMLLQTMRRIEARGAIETAHRALQSCGQVFMYAIASGKAQRNPAADLRGALKPVDVTHMPAITDPKRVGELLRSIEAYEGHPVTRAALQLAPLVFVRPGELRKAEWSEFDLDGAAWMIDSTRMKRTKKQKATGAPHYVPLSRQAVEVLRDLHPLTGHGRFVFPSLRTGERPMSDNAVLSALRRMGYPKDEMTGHGFRAMARTMLAERLNVDEAVIEAQLAHAVNDSLGRSYNRTEFVDQRRELMSKWANYLDELRQGAAVIQFDKNRAGR